MIGERAANEKAATDSGRVYEEHAKLRQRFRHVDLCPNCQRCEAFMQAWYARVVPGADVLDLGCQEGVSTAYYARLGARRVVGIDISPVAIEKARRLGELAPHGTEFHVRDAHHTGFADASFDAVIGHAILHHLDFAAAIAEIRRVLRPGGYAVFREPLRDNPAAKLIRVLTPRARTADELPLSRAQIEWADAQFSSSHHGYYGLASTGLGLATSLLAPAASADNPVLRVADRLDVGAARTALRYWMRTVALVWRK